MSEEQYVDMEGMTVWIAEHTDLPRTAVGAALMLEMDYMQAVGIMTDPGWKSLGYYPAGPKEHSLELDCDRLAQDAERLFGISAETALAVYEAESSFLEMRGLLTREDNPDSLSK